MELGWNVWAKSGTVYSVADKMHAYFNDSDDSAMENKFNVSLLKSLRMSNGYYVSQDIRLQRHVFLSGSISVSVTRNDT